MSKQQATFVDPADIHHLHAAIALTVRSIETTRHAGLMMTAKRSESMLRTRVLTLTGYTITPLFDMSRSLTNADEVILIAETPEKDHRLMVKLSGNLAYGATVRVSDLTTSSSSVARFNEGRLTKALRQLVTSDLRLVSVAAPEKQDALERA